MQQSEVEKLRAAGATVQEVKLERIKWACLAELEKADIDAMVDISTMAEFARDLIAVRVYGYVWGETLDKRTIRHPLNWIEAVKERWLPYWLRPHWPVRYKVHHIEAKAYYPGIRASLPNEPWRIAAYVREQEGGANDCQDAGVGNRRD